MWVLSWEATSIGLGIVLMVSKKGKARFGASGVGRLRAARTSSRVGQQPTVCHGHGTCNTRNAMQCKQRVAILLGGIIKLEMATCSVSAVNKIAIYPEIPGSALPEVIALSPWREGEVPTQSQLAPECRRALFRLTAENAILPGPERVASPASRLPRPRLPQGPTPFRPTPKIKSHIFCLFFSSSR